MHFVEVTVLPEISTCDTLSAARLNSLDPLRTPRCLYVYHNARIHYPSKS